jgi:hypothetical protein
VYLLTLDLPSPHGTESSFSCSEEPETERNFERITSSPLALNFKCQFNFCPDLQLIPSDCCYV